MDAEDKSLSFIVDLFENYLNLDHLIILMPFEFSIQLDLDPIDKRYEVADPVLMSFYDLMETFETLKTSQQISIYHEKQIDELAAELESIWARFWIPSDDPIRNEVKIAREFYSLLEKTPLNPFIEMFYKRYYYKEGLVDFNLDDPLQEPIIERLFEERRRKNQFKRKTLMKISAFQLKLMEKKLKVSARLMWERYLESGRLKYYPPQKAYSK